jgi:hexosaminidase
MSTIPLLLVPQPRSCVMTQGSFDLARGGGVALTGAPESLLPALQTLERDLGPRWRPAINPDARTLAEAAIRLTLEPGATPPQGYRLRIDSAAITATAVDAAGLLYAAMTLRQIARVAGDILPACRIEDAPDFPVRGVMLDISRDKVPTLSTLFALVDQFAEWKINHLELYTEHTFAYRNHGDVWQSASPMTADEIRALDAYCRARCIDLAPNQNSFGHLERWLKLPRYNDLAECPNGGAPLPWGGTFPTAYSLNPLDPRSIDLLRELYAELLPNFSSRFFNVGCDETFDLGHGKSREHVAQVGRGRAYLDFLLQIHKLVRSHGRTMTFWGDIIIHHPELVPDLPRDCVALEWGYEANHPFAEHAAQFAAAGVPFHVCPGTSAWSSLAGRTANMRANLLAATEHGLRHGATGFLNTDWGDSGHWQTFPVSYPGFLLGAALSWCRAANAGLPLAAALDTHAFADDAGILGGLTLDMGDAYRLCGHERGNSTELFQILAYGVDRAIGAGVTPATLAASRAVAEDALVRLPQARSRRPDATWLIDETEQTARLLIHACNRGIVLLEGGIANPKRRRALAREMDAVMAGHERVWLRRNRPGGLCDSLDRMARRRAEYN